MHNSEATDSHKVPKNRTAIWALYARRMGNGCPILGLSMPDTWFLSAHLMGTDGTPNKLRQNILCIFIPNPTCQSFLLFLVCVYILYILEE